MENDKMPSVSLVYDRKKTGGRNKEAVIEIRISYDYRKKRQARTLQRWTRRVQWTCAPSSTAA